MEGAVLEDVRRVVGSAVPIIVPLDHHANVTRRMVENADVLVGHETDARKTLESARRLEPNLSIAVMARIYGISGAGRSRHAHRLLDALRKAGLPE